MSNSEGKQYLRQLLYKATEYINGRWVSGFDDVEFFYRCKSDEYFSEVKRNNNVLEPIMKDNNGDRKSPINGKVEGVFLGVDLYMGTLPTASPFGGTRVAFPIEAIFTEGTCLYFTDFYCTVSSYHYVTLVLTKAGSSVDRFCNLYLLKLDPFDNPFLLKSGQRFSVVKADLLHVEVFYTEKVDLNHLEMRFGPSKVFFRSIGIIGRGSSTWGGLMKKSYCAVCNPTSGTPTTSPLIEKSPLTSWSPTHPVTTRRSYEVIKKSAPSVPTRSLRARSHTVPDQPMHNLQATPDMRTSVCGRKSTPRVNSSWWNWFTRWWIWVLLFCAALYLVMLLVKKI